MKKIANRILLILVVVSVPALGYEFKANEYSCREFTSAEVGKYHIIKFKNGLTKFSVNRGKPSSCKFYANSNFFTPDNEVIGGLVIDGRTIHSQLAGGGSFAVVNGKPIISFKKIRKCTQLSQSIVWLIRAGRINKSALASRTATKLNYRLMIGKDASGNVIVINTGSLERSTLSDMVSFAKERGVVDAIMLDSGSSVDVGIRNGNYSYSSKSCPSTIKQILGIAEPPAYIVGNF